VDESVFCVLAPWRDAAMAGLKPCATTDPHPDYDYDNDNDSELNYMPYMSYMVNKAAFPSAFSLSFHHEET